MMTAISNVLRQFAAAWNQRGVSIWEIRGGHPVLSAEWMESSRPELVEEWIREGLATDKTAWVREDRTSLFIERPWAVAFYGGEPLTREEWARVIPFTAPWFELLLQAAGQERREDSFQSLVRVAHTIVSSMQDESILDLILETAIDTILSADTGFLFLYDELLQKLRIRSAVGFRKESYTLTRLAPGEGISGQVFASRQPMLIAGRANIKAAMGNMTDTNAKYYLESTIYSSYPVSVISIPLVYQNKAIGVLTLDNFLKSDSSFTHEDLQLLQTFADLSAVVIEHANLFRRVQHQNQELSVMHQALSKEHENLQKTFDFHNRLTHIVTRGDGVEEILETLYRTVKVPIAVYDRLLVPVSSYPKDVSVELPDQFLMHPSMILVNKMRKWQRVDFQEEQQTIMVIPIIGTERMMGYLCAWISSQEFKEIGKLIFEYSATVLALEWIKEEAIRESQERMMGHFVEDILAGEMNGQLIEQARVLGFKQEHYYSVLLVQSKHRAKARDHAWRTRIYGWMEKYGLVGLMVRKGKHDVVIVSFQGVPNADQRVGILRSFMAELQKQEGLRIGVGRIQHGLPRIEKSFKDALQCLELMERHYSQKSALYYGDLGIVRFFVEHDREELQSYMEEYLGPLLEYEREKNKGLLVTLLAYVQHDRDLTKVKNELSIHHNTLYYRINRIEDILGYPLNQSDEWFNVKLACQIYLFLGEQGQ
jgi:sugar diacid utilization regulator/putative methionine-R-sulfoxide reductase with GAF domain